MVCLTLLAVTGCTLRAIPIERDGAMEPVDGSSADAARPVDGDAGDPPTDGGERDGAIPRECHGAAPACTAAILVPSEERWVGYWSADHGLEVETRAAPSGGHELALARWRSLVGDASLVFPDDVAALYPDATTPEMRAPLYQPAGWRADFTTETCAAGDCLGAVRLRRAPSPAPSGQGDLLATLDGAAIDAMRSGAAITIALQVEIAPDPATRTVTLFSFADASENFPYLRGYVSGTTFRLQSQDVFGGTPLRVDFDGAIRRASDSVVIYVIDPAAGEVAALYRSDDGAPVSRSSATSETAIHFPQAGADKLTIGSLGRRSITDAFDGRIRRFAISASAIPIEELETIAQTWRDEDRALGRSPAVRYANAIASSGPALFARLGASLPGSALPSGARLVERAALEDCAASFSIEADRGGVIEIPDHDALSIASSGQGLTIEAWVRVAEPNPLGAPAEGGNDDFIDWLGKGEGDELEWALRLRREDAAQAPRAIEAIAWSREASAIDDGFAAMCERDPSRWIHVALVSDDPAAPGAALRLYVNAIPGAGEDNLYAGLGLSNGSAPLRIGARSPPPTPMAGGFLDGEVADLAIYPRALSASEILAHYEAAEGLRY